MIEQVWKINPAKFGRQFFYFVAFETTIKFFYLVLKKYVLVPFNGENKRKSPRAHISNIKKN